MTTPNENEDKEKLETPLFDLEDAYLDIDAIEDGRWIPIGAEFPGVEVLATGLSVKATEKYHEMLERNAPRKERLANGTLTSDSRNKILRQVVRDKCIHDWRGIGFQGKALPFTKAQLGEILEDPKARRLAAAFINAITDLEQTKLRREDAVAKN